MCEAGASPSAEFREVLESIPVPQITEEVSHRFFFVSLLLLVFFLVRTYDRRDNAVVGGNVLEVSEGKNWVIGGVVPGPGEHTLPADHGGG